MWASLHTIHFAPVRTISISPCLCFVQVCKSRFLTLREKDTLRVFKNRVPRGILGPRKHEMTKAGENSIMTSLIICTAHYKLAYQDDQTKTEMGGPRGRQETSTNFGWKAVSEDAIREILQSSANGFICDGRMYCAGQNVNSSPRGVTSDPTSSRRFFM
jgi:hypothetical protein